MTATPKQRTSFSGWLRRMLEWVLAGLLSMLSLLVFYQVLARYIPAIPSLLWTEEIARGLLLWLVLLGAGVGVVERSHFQLSILLRKTGPWLHRLVCFLVLVSGAYLTVSAFALSQKGTGRVSLVTGLPAIWVYLALLCGGVMIVCGSVWVLAKNPRTPLDRSARDQGARSGGQRRPDNPRNPAEHP